MDDHKNESSSSPPLHHPLDDSTTSNLATTAATTTTTTTTLFAFVGEWMILFITFSIALFFIPLTPAFTLHSTTASVLNITQNNFTANLGVSFFVETTNPFEGSINYASFNASLFHNNQKLSTLVSLQQETTTLLAMFHNVSLTIDEWGHHHHRDGASSSCGFAFMDLWFSVDAKRDKLQGHCGEVKFELCTSSEATNIVAVPSFLASCDVYSALVHKVRLGVLLLLMILLLVSAAPVPLLVEQFSCFDS